MFYDCQSYQYIRYLIEDRDENCSCVFIEMTKKHFVKFSEITMKIKKPTYDKYCSSKNNTKNYIYIERERDGEIERKKTAYSLWGILKNIFLLMIWSSTMNKKIKKEFSLSLSIYIYIYIYIYILQLILAGEFLKTFSS